VDTGGGVPEKKNGRDLKKELMQKGGIKRKKIQSSAVGRCQRRVGGGLPAAHILREEIAGPQNHSAQIKRGGDTGANPPSRER